MKIIATNIGEKKEVQYRGKTVVTGIYKYPVAEGIYLESTDVKNDTVVDRKYHGGVDKACYLYSLEAYSYFKNLFPDADWSYGMFGENLTVLGLDERLIKVGAKYQIGEAIIEVSEPRQPCFKQGIRMGTQAVLKPFINSTHSGVYVRVLQNGHVNPEDELQLIEDKQDNPTIAEAFYCLYQPELKRSLIEKVLNCKELAESCKNDIQRRLG